MDAVSRESSSYGLVFEKKDSLDIVSGILCNL